MPTVPPPHSTTTDPFDDALDDALADLQPYVSTIIKQLTQVAPPRDGTHPQHFYAKLTDDFLHTSARDWNKTENWIKQACTAWAEQNGINPPTPIQVIYNLHHFAHSQPQTQTDSDPHAPQRQQQRQQQQLDQLVSDLYEEADDTGRRRLRMIANGADAIAIAREETGNIGRNVDTREIDEYIAFIYSELQLPETQDTNQQLITLQPLLAKLKDRTHLKKSEQMGYREWLENYGDKISYTIINDTLRSQRKSILRSAILAAKEGKYTYEEQRAYSCSSPELAPFSEVTSFENVWSRMLVLAIPEIVNMILKDRPIAVSLLIQQGKIEIETSVASTGSQSSQPAAIQGYQPGFDRVRPDEGSITFDYWVDNLRKGITLSDFVQRVKLKRLSSSWRTIVRAVTKGATDCDQVAQLSGLSGSSIDNLVGKFGSCLNGAALSYDDRVKALHLLVSDHDQGDPSFSILDSK